MLGFHSTLHIPESCVVDPCSPFAGGGAYLFAGGEGGLVLVDVLLVHLVRHQHQAGQQQQQHRHKGVNTAVATDETAIRASASRQYVCTPMSTFPRLFGRSPLNDAKLQGGVSPEEATLNGNPPATCEPRPTGKSSKTIFLYPEEATLKINPPA